MARNLSRMTATKSRRRRRKRWCPPTDPESGVFHKGEQKCFAYEAQYTACDKHNFVVGVHVTPGNIHDSVAFDPLYDEVCQYYPGAQNRGGGQRLQNTLDLQAYF